MQIARFKFSLSLIAMAILFVVVMPATSFAQDRGRGRGENGYWGRKCGKFVNCHDARDGRRDGRGGRSVTGAYRTNVYWQNRASRRYANGTRYYSQRRYVIRRSSDRDWNRRNMVRRRW